MLNANAKKWLNALRSGKYKQGRARLKSADEFCCLGVACDISGLGKWDKDKYLGKEAFLPIQVMNWLGLSTMQGVYYDELSLSQLNDIGHSFRFIANFIESDPKGLFKGE
jgi:hypothetical protein